MKVLQKNFAVVFSYLLSVYVERGCGIQMVNNGYTDIMIAIKPSVTYDERLTEKIQAMMTEASSFLHQATKQKLYFSDVKILLPKTWPVNPSLIQRPTSQSYEKANVIIAEPNPLYGDTPYTLQYGGCGEKGLYIHLTSNFLLNDSLVQVYGKKGRTFVHEWSHLQWGVFNEYDDQKPFYTSSDGIMEATRCSKEIKGVIKDCSSGDCSDCNEKRVLLDGHCTFYPEKNQSASSSIMYNQGLGNVGTWNYNITNTGNKQQATVTVISRAADEHVPPVTVSTKIIRKNHTSPVLIYVKVSKGFLPVLSARVIIIAESLTGHTEKVELLDNGVGADIVSNDGVYSKYFLNATEHGRYNFMVRVKGKEGSTTKTNRTDGSAMYIPGYTENGVIHLNPPRPPVSKENSVAQIGIFSRVKSGGALLVPAGAPIINFPPCKVTDLQATTEKDKIELQWTAPGADLDQGTASYYELRMSDKLLLLLNSFSGEEQVNLTSLKPQPFGSKETFTITIGSTELKNTTTFYFALCAYDEKDQSSEMSNVASASFFVPLPDEMVSNVTSVSFFVPLPDEMVSNVTSVSFSVPLPGAPEDNKVRVLHSIWIAVAVAVMVCLIIGITYYIVEKKYKMRFPVAMITYRRFSC